MNPKFRLFLTTILIVFTTAKVNSITELKQESFSQKTGILIDQQDGSILSNKNSMIYFFISGQQTQQSVTNSRKQFENTAKSYVKSKQQNIIISQNLDQQAQNQDSKSKAQIQSTQNLENLESNDPKDPNSINFFIVKCPKSQEISDQETRICTNLGIYENQANAKIFFFTSKSQIIKFDSQITEDKLFLIIAKIQQNSQLFETYVNFDEELQKMASKFELKNISLKNKALGWMQKLKSYLTWDLLKFLVIFGVLPFLFGYLSSKSQQKANKKRMQKYGVNTEQNTQTKSKQPKELKKQ